MSLSIIFNIVLFKAQL